jgi:electron transport complex protein RnfE
VANENTMTAGTAFWNGIWKENPTFRLMLGMCPTMAVTTSLRGAITMGMCVIFVLICSNLVISLVRNLLKPHLRILMFTLIIAAFVTVAELFLQAYQPEMSDKLGAYIPLIIVNCIIICRSEACASKNGLWVSAVDGLAMGLGFTISVAFLATIREILSTGKLFDIPVLTTVENGGWFIPWIGVGMPVGAFVTLGLALGTANYLQQRKRR